MEDKEILSNILEALDITANKLATKMGYASASSIYHILNGDNKISMDMAKKLVEIYPQVNYLYVTLGEEPILLGRSESRGQGNLFYKDRASFDEVPQTLLEIKELLKKILEKLG
jgi:transcriptional regulator with XRE-family HTH domain